MWDNMSFWVYMVPFWYPKLWYTKGSPRQKDKIEYKECHLSRRSRYRKILLYEYILLYNWKQWSWEALHRFDIQKTTYRKPLDNVPTHWNASHDQPNVNSFSIKFLGYGHFSKYYCSIMSNSLVRQNELNTFLRVKLNLN